MDQRVSPTPGNEILLRGQVRSPQAGAKLSISLCEKSMLNSLNCEQAYVLTGPTWRPFEVRMLSPQRSGTGPGPSAPVSISLQNGQFGSRVEVTQLSLVDKNVDLISNGAFEDGLDHWFVTSDVHLAWRVHNTPLQIAFEQGVLGVAAWLAMILAAIVLVWRTSA